MKTIALAGMMILVMTGTVTGQGKYMTNQGKITFYSHTSIEDITAVNEEVGSVIDAGTGQVAVIAKMTAFQFQKKLMQEHFNENYVESEKFPRSTFNGTITNNDDVDYRTPGKYNVNVVGELTIHGVTRPIEAEGSVEVGSRDIIARTKFMLNPEDYGIQIPAVVRNNIAEHMEITVYLDNMPL
jgi:hypothetical protein